LISQDWDHSLKVAAAKEQGEFGLKWGNLAHFNFLFAVSNAVTAALVPRVL